MSARIRRHIIPGLLIFCTVLVGFWETMAYRSAKPFRPFGLTEQDFADFHPSSARWSFRGVPSVEFDRSAPNLLSFAATSPGGNAVVVRLVHGYNMPMCMKIKGYECAILRNGAPDRDNQVWRLVSGSGETSVWITALIRSGDFGRTDTDDRSIAFPRIAARDDPNWLPRGLTAESLKHPIRNFRIAFRARWNNARCDIATFLRLRQPAWAAENVLVLVAHSQGLSVGPGEMEAVGRRVSEAHAAALEALQQWRVAPPPAGDTASPAP